jgi:hypothetical protein
MNTLFTTPPAPKEHSEKVVAVIAKVEAAITGTPITETTTTQPNG